MSTIQGKPESENILGTPGDDIVDGGQGFDTFQLQTKGAIHFELNAAKQWVVVSEQGQDTLQDVEQVQTFEAETLLNARHPKKFLPVKSASQDQLNLPDGSRLQVKYRDLFNEEFFIDIEHYSANGQLISTFHIPNDYAEGSRVTGLYTQSDGGYVVQWKDDTGAHSLRFNAQNQVLPEIASPLPGVTDSTPLTTALANGFSLQTWVSFSEANGYEIWAQAFNASNTSLRPAQRINTETLSAPVSVSVYTLTPDQFEISWRKLNPDGSLLDKLFTQSRAFESIGESTSVTGLLDYAEYDFGPVKLPKPSLSGSSKKDLLQFKGVHSIALFGEEGNDVLQGGSGNDFLSGGAGRDRFEFLASNNGVDLISDWGRGDTIAIQGASFDSSSFSAGDGSQVKPHQVQWQSNGDMTTLYIGTDEQAGADVVIQLAGQQTPDQWVLAGNAIHWLESLSNEQPATDIQWVQLSGKRQDYQLIHDWEGVTSGRGVEGVWSARKLATGEVIELIGAERLAFDDQSIALDLHDGGSLQPALSLLAASLGADKLNNPVLMGQYLAQVDALGQKGAAQLIADIGLLQREAGSNEIADVLSLLYKNVTGHAPEAGELAQLLQINEQQHWSVTDWLLLAAHEPLLSRQIEPHVNLIDVMQNGWRIEAWNGSIWGTSGDDLLQAVQGQSNTYEGTPGIDTLQVAGFASDFQLNALSDTTQALRSLSSDDSLTLKGIERLKFDDHQLALDLHGNAGDAAALIRVLYGDSGWQNKALLGEVIYYVDNMGTDALIQTALTNGVLEEVLSTQLTSFALISSSKTASAPKEFSLREELDRLVLDPSTTHLVLNMQQKVQHWSLLIELQATQTKEITDEMKTIIQKQQIEEEIQATSSSIRDGIINLMVDAKHEVAIKLAAVQEIGLQYEAWGQ